MLANSICNSHEPSVKRGYVALRMWIVVSNVGAEMVNRLEGFSKRKLAGLQRTKWAKQTLTAVVVTNTRKEMQSINA